MSNHDTDREPDQTVFNVELPPCETVDALERRVAHLRWLLIKYRLKGHCTVTMEITETDDPTVADTPIVIPAPSDEPKS